MPQTTAPLVSVLIPVYKVENFIARCLTSVLEQTYRPLEVILCDDKSPDNSMAIAQKMLATPPEGITVRFLVNSENRGLTYTRGELLKAATGKYLLWLDSDDYWDAPSNVSCIVTEMLKTGVDVLLFDYYANYLKKEVYMHVDCPDNGAAAAVAILTGKMGAFMWNKCFHADIFKEKAGRFNPDNPIMEDMQAVVPLFARGASVGYLPIPVLHYVQYNTNSIISRLSLTTIDNYFRAIAACEEVLLALDPEKYRIPLQIAYLNAKAALLMRAVYQDYRAIRRFYPEVDKLNHLRQQPWHNRFIYSLQCCPATSYMGYLSAKSMAYVKQLLRN